MGDDKPYPAFPAPQSKRESAETDSDSPAGIARIFSKWEGGLARAYCQSSSF